MADDPHGASSALPFPTAVRVWIRVALNSFGGPAGQIAVMHRILVEEKRWISENRFLHALNYCMLLPGPEAQQLAIYIGWLLNGTAGGLAAGTLFVLPGFVAILALSYVYAAFQSVGFVTAMFFGLKAAVLAVVVEAVVRIGRRVLKNRVMLLIAALAFIGIFFFGVPFPFIVLGAGLTGLLGGQLRPESFVVIRPHETEPAPGDEPIVDALAHDRASARAQTSISRALRVAVLFLILWFAPLAILAALFGPDDIFVKVGLFFSKAATVTFGGAYSVLAYIAQQAVEHYHWLRPGEMLDGLGMAETTPGPLIQVVQFVGFMGCYRNPGSLHPLVAGTLGAVLTAWVTFVPCFLWIFVGAPYIESLRGNRRLGAALSTITAAVVGVVLNLAVWFALHILFSEVHALHIPLGVRLLVPVWSTLNVSAMLISLGAFVALFRFRLGMLPVLGLSTLAGLLVHA